MTLPKDLCQSLRMIMALKADIPTLELPKLIADLKLKITLPSLDELIKDIKFPDCEE
ncbi:MAG: hypothetical protein SNJ64_04480 [Endomicrobiia bacterium]